MTTGEYLIFETKMSSATTSFFIFTIRPISIVRHADLTRTCQPFTWQIDKATSDAKEHGELEVNAKFRATAEPSGYCESVSFNCDHRDCQYIPGLYRGGTWGSLTPVYFSPEVLQKYGSDNRYKLEMPSRTSGIVLMPDDDQIGFGVNRRGEVIMWAGDVCSLTRREQLHLAAENIPSSHDVGSDFYDSQIEIEYPELSGPAKLFDVRARFNRAVQDKFKFKPTRLDSESSALISTFNPPIDRARQGVERAIHEMEKICVETINASEFPQRFDRPWRRRARWGQSEGT